MSAGLTVALVAASPPTLAALLAYGAARASARQAATERAAVIDQSLDSLNAAVARVEAAVARVESGVGDLRERVARLEGAHQPGAVGG